MSDAAPTLDKATKRKLLKNDVALAYGKVRAAEDVVQEITIEATPAIKALVDAEGPGPHKFRDAGGVFWLTFRKAKDAEHYNIKRKNETADDDAAAVPDGAAPAAAPPT